MNPSKSLRSVRATFTRSMTFECGFNFRFSLKRLLPLLQFHPKKLACPSSLWVSYLHSDASTSSRHRLTLSCAIHHREQEKKKKTAIDFFPHRTNSQFCLYGKLWWSQRWFLVVVVLSSSIALSPLLLCTDLRRPLLTHIPSSHASQDQQQPNAPFQVCHSCLVRTYPPQSTHSCKCHSHRRPPRAFSTPTLVCVIVVSTRTTSFLR